jgi:hypothetical protein
MLKCRPKLNKDMASLRRRLCDCRERGSIEASKARIAFLKHNIRKLKTLSRIDQIKAELEKLKAT